jgi:hypothetical protein
MRVCVSVSVYVCVCVGVGVGVGVWVWVCRYVHVNVNTCVRDRGWSCLRRGGGSIIPIGTGGAIDKACSTEESGWCRGWYQATGALQSCNGGHVTET